MREAKILIVLDSKKYKEKEDGLRNEIGNLCEPEFYFTDYENRLIKIFHGISGIGNFLSHISYWMLSLVAAISLFAKKRGNLYRSKVFINPIVGIFYCFLLAIFDGRDRVTVAGFLFVDKKSKLYLVLRKAFVRFAYGRASKIIVYSRGEVQVYSKLFPRLAQKFVFVRYGRDYDIFAEREYESCAPYVASGGVSNRDYDTLARALNILEKRRPSMICKIATRPDSCTLSCNPGNLALLHDIRLETFGSFLAKSLFVVLPLKDTPLSAGHMALLESMYRRKIIIVADIPGVRDYVDESTVYFYKAGDSSNLAEVIDYVFENMESEIVQGKAVLAQNVFRSTYRFSSFLKRIVLEAASLPAFDDCERGA